MHYQMKVQDQIIRSHSWDKIFVLFLKYQHFVCLCLAKCHWCCESYAAVVHVRFGAPTFHKLNPAEKIYIKAFPPKYVTYNSCRLNQQTQLVVVLFRSSNCCIITFNISQRVAQHTCTGLVCNCCPGNSDLFHDSFEFAARLNCTIISKTTFDSTR